MEIYKSIKKLLTNEEPDNDAVIDDFAFRLHSRFTVGIFAVCLALVTAKNYIESPILCLNEGNPKRFIDSYCLTHSTFAGPDINRINPRFKTEVYKYQKYYLWVNLVFFVQGVLFSLPGWLWSTWEGGKINKLRSISERALGAYFIHKRNKHRSYFNLYLLCEILHFLIDLLQIFLMDLFFEGEFAQFGIDIINVFFINPELRDDPLERVFPKLVKCSFENIGASGTKQLHDSLCVLTLNIVNEKIFTFLWFWYLILLLSSIFSMIYNIAAIFSTKFRIFTMKIPIEYSGTLEKIRKLDYADWFLVKRLGENLDNEAYTSLINNLENNN